MYYTALYSVDTEQPAEKMRVHMLGDVCPVAVFLDQAIRKQSLFQALPCVHTLM